MIVVLLKGGSLVVTGDITAGELTSFLLYSTYVGVRIAMLGSSYSDIMKAVGASDRVFEILNRRPKLVAPDMDEAAVEDVNYDCGCHKQHHPEISTGNIEFRDVHLFICWQE